MKVFVLIPFLLTCITAFKSLPPIDVYTGTYLGKKHVSKEHVIPRRYFLSKEHANDILNIVPCDRYVNGMRSDFKFGFLYYDNIDDHHLMEVYNYQNELSGYVNKRTRTFYPGGDADFGLLGRSIVELLKKYPYLYRSLPEIVESPTVISIWCTYPVSEFENLRKHHLSS